MRPAGQASTHAHAQADGRRNDDYYPVETPPDSVTSATARTVGQDHYYCSAQFGNHTTTFVGSCGIPISF